MTADLHSARAGGVDDAMWGNHGAIAQFQTSLILAPLHPTQVQDAPGLHDHFPLDPQISKIALNLHPGLNAESRETPPD